MKKLLNILLLTALLFGIPGSAVSEAPADQGADIALDEDSWLSSSAYVDGKLYLIDDGEFFSYTPGDETAVKIDLQDLRTREAGEEAARGGAFDRYYSLRLFEDSGKLYAAEFQQQGIIYPLTEQDGGLTITDGVLIDVSPLRNMDWGDEGYVEDPMQVLGHAGRVYLVNRSWDNAGFTQMSLLSYDIALGGEAKRHDAEFIWRLASYKDGDLIALVMDPDNVWDEKTSQMRNTMLVRFDPEEDYVSELGDSGVPFEYENAGLAYDEELDRIYLLGKSEIYVFDDKGPAEVAAYLKPSQYGGGLSDGIFALGDGRVAVISGQSLSLRMADPAMLPEGRLTIYGGYMDDGHQKAMAAMGGMPVTFLESKWFGSAQELGQALVTGEDNIDILMFSGDYIDINNLMSKGYAADLSSSLVLRDYMDSLYPMMKEAGMYGEKLYMIPVDMYTHGLMSYYTKLVEEVEGLELPRTFAELIDLLQLWNDELGEKYPDIVPLQSDDYKSRMVQMAISLQQDAKAVEGEEFVYNDPQLKDMLERALALNTEDIAPRIDWEMDNSQELLDEIYSKAPLMQDYYWVDLQSMNYSLTGMDDDNAASWGSDGKLFDVGRMVPLQFGIKEGDKLIVPIQLTMMAVNPKSKHIDAAIAYIEKYTDSILPEKRAMMNPSMNDDILNPNYERSIEWMAESLSYYEEAIKNAQGAEKTELEANYERQKKYFEDRREEARYIVRKETIAAYRELIENSYIRTYEHGMAFNNEEMYSLYSRLIEGQMPLEQFLNEADGKLRLMRLEGM